MMVKGFTKDEMSVHDFRAMARTIVDKVVGLRVDFIEHQLAYALRDANGRAYNRTSHLPERHKMMQSWSDYLDPLKGLISGVMAMVMSELMLLALYTQVLHISYRPSFYLWLLVPVTNAVLISVVGSWGVRQVLNKPPLLVLRAL